MIKRICLTLLMALFAGSTAQGQLYLLTGSPTEKYPESFGSALIRIDADGVVKEMLELVRPSVGTQWINISFDLKKAVVLSGSKEDAVIVLDFEKADISKKCKRPESAGRSLIYSWLANPPAATPSFEWFETGSDPVKDSVVRGMVLDPSIPCGDSFADRLPESIRNAVEAGHAGIADVVSQSPIDVAVDSSDGRTFSFDGKRIPLEYTIPAELRIGIEIRGSALLINDSHVFAIMLADRGNNHRVLLFRKRDRTWHVLPIASERQPYVRGFGDYIAVTEVGTPHNRNTKSAGSEKWKQESRRMGPSLAGRLDGANTVLSGKLYLYNVENERTFSITTGQGDSEVLLVEDSTVYYRAGDQLHSARITEKGLAPARLLATHDAISDAHWGFIKH